jgi:hypothetical protein
MIKLVLVLAVGANPLLKVTQECALDRLTSRLVVHSAIESNWVDQGKVRSSGAELFSITCRLEARTCTGARIALGKGPLASKDIAVLVPIAVASAAGPVVVLRWGVHQFVVDLASGTVTKTDSGGSRGVGSCGQLRFNTEDLISWRD